ncbi:hypothetical protein SLS53_008093 [Cytospora paraplurivora]|uniref:RING-type domain-containing protein n=1 Tax=Cytospora paraplurivora TaxID=2898453 RepID=A0AAN9U1A1_9PEZI
MESSKPALDLEKELTCSICTELLYHPLTLLDCLHTFCGACLTDWFNWQATAAENAPIPPAPGTPIFTCPSCRASVRDTRHNATVVSLLDMVLAAHPEKTKPEAEKEEMNAKYRPGDKVLRDLNLPERTPDQLRLEERERDLIDSVRQISLQEAVNGGVSANPRSRRLREASHSRNGSSHRTRETSTNRDHRAGVRTRDQQPRRRSTLEGDATSRAEAPTRLAPETAEGRPEAGRNGSSGLRQREWQRRQIEHQSSLRSLISSSDAADIDMEREVEEFARQIQEEGLLDGLDLDNLDLTNDDELSRKITEAYRRRQRERERQRLEARERSRATSRHSYSGPSGPRPHLGGSSSNLAASNGLTVERRSRSPSAASQSEEHSRPPISSRSTHLDVHESRRRRRTASRSRDRSSTLPAGPPPLELRAGPRPQTASDTRSNSLGTNTRRPVITEGRSASTSDVTSSNQGIVVESPSQMALPFSARASGLNIVQSRESPSSSSSSESSTRSTRPKPTDIVVQPPATSPPKPSQSLLASPPSSSSGHAKLRAQMYPEPAIDCNSCGKEHIEYELHYHCEDCDDGSWNICLKCYRLGKGCHHWFGFGYGGHSRWERLRKSDPSLPEPHKLLASRYLPATAMVASAAEDRKAWSTADPYERLQSGTFCAACLAWSNECYWRCDVCNEGDWGFCNDCVNQGRCCTHALLPLAHRFALQQQQQQQQQPPGGGGGGGKPPSASPPPSPRSASRPSSATMMVGLNAVSIGPFKVLTFVTTCDLCRMPIAPTQSRLHCFACVSSIVPGSRPGDYDICEQCYGGLVHRGAVSAENGPEGWRRCPQGHRMVVVGFQDSKDGQRRYTARDLVGGRRLQVEPLAVPGEGGGVGLQRFVWYDGDDRRERLVSRDVSQAVGGAGAGDVPFPPDGGYGWKAVARWAWYPAAGADDELLFPRGAAITEIEDANGEWFHGVYMGAKGLFPAPYVKILQ